MRLAKTKASPLTIPAATRLSTKENPPSRFELKILNPPVNYS